MNHNLLNPELELLIWKADERALLARAEVLRLLRPPPSETARLRDGLFRIVGNVLIHVGQWLTEQSEAAQPRAIQPTM